MDLSPINSATRTVQYDAKSTYPTRMSNDAMGALAATRRQRRAGARDGIERRRARCSERDYSPPSPERSASQPSDCTASRHLINEIRSGGNALAADDSHWLRGRV